MPLLLVLLFGLAGQAQPSLRQAAERQQQQLSQGLGHQVSPNLLHLPLGALGSNCRLDEAWARYYAAAGDYPRTEAAWLAAYHQARQAHVAPLCLVYLRALARFYQQRAQLGRAAPYALAALALADTLGGAPAVVRVGWYGPVQAIRPQPARLASPPPVQVQNAARTQYLPLGGTLGAAVLLAGAALLLRRSQRRPQQVVLLQEAQEEHTVESVGHFHQPIDLYQPAQPCVVTPPADEPGLCSGPAPVGSPPASAIVSSAGVAAPPARRRRPTLIAEASQLSQWLIMVAPRLADEQFGPAQLADLLCLSERTLYRRLGQLTGFAPAAWLRELRLHKARQLFEAGGFGSVASVADAVGFASPKYFASLYAERFGCRPSDYRA